MATIISFNNKIVHGVIGFKFFPKVSMDKIKLTTAQKRELLILKEYSSITTEGRGFRYNVLLRLEQKCLCSKGVTSHSNVFRILEEGIKFKI